MFVFQSTYDKLKRKHRKVTSEVYALRLELAAITRKWNDLVNRVNALGGEKFLNETKPDTQFNLAEIRQLLSLCHPDKHNGKPAATEITRKLISLRNHLN